MGALALIMGFGSATALGEASLAAALDAAQGQIDALRDRSPGIRTEANMSKGKLRASARALPAARNATSAIAAPVADTVPGPIAALLPTAGGATAPGLAGTLPNETPGGGAILPGGGMFAGGSGGFLPGSGGIGGGIGIGGGGGGGGIVVLPPGEAGTEPAEETPPGVVITPPTPTPVPEPSRWALMILGFGLVGGALRSAARRAAACHSHARA